VTVKPDETAPALGMSLQFDLGAGRVCTMQTFLPRDCAAVELNRTLDKMTAAGDRQRAHYKIEELERDLAQLEKDHAQHAEDLARLDADYAEAQERRAQQAEKAAQALGNFESVRASDAQERGRRAPGALKGAVLSEFKRTQEGIERLKGEMLAATEEHAKAHAASTVTIDRRAALIEKTKSEIARCRAIVADGLKA
jgi:chromosome segregation ATPase